MGIVGYYLSQVGKRKVSSYLILSYLVSSYVGSKYLILCRVKCMVSLCSRGGGGKKIKVGKGIGWAYRDPDISPKYDSYSYSPISIFRFVFYFSFFHCLFFVIIFLIFLFWFFRSFYLSVPF